MKGSIPPPRFVNASEWHRALGKVPLKRILFDPWPGTATEDDLIAQVEKKELCELICHTLVAKPLDFRKSLIGVSLICHVMNFADPRRLGCAVGPTVPFRFAPGIVRLPDMTFTRKETFPGGRLPREPIVPFAPDLAIDICCRGTTAREIDLKVRHYFEGGTKLAWVITQEPRGARIFYSPQTVTSIDGDGMLSGGDVLPGLKIPLANAFEQIDAYS